jgi:hypothetical protein
MVNPVGAVVVSGGVIAREGATVPVIALRTPVSVTSTEKQIRPFLRYLEEGI